MAFSGNTLSIDYIGLNGFGEWRDDLLWGMTTPQWQSEAGKQRFEREREVSFLKSGAMSAGFDADMFFSPVMWYRRMKCGAHSIKKKVSEELLRMEYDIDAVVKLELEVAGPKLYGYPGQGDSSTLFYYHFKSYVTWNDAQNKEELKYAIKRGFFVLCRMKVYYLVNCECACGNDVLHAWSEIYDSTYLYGKLGWYELAGRPFCDCMGTSNVFFTMQRDKHADACQLRK